MYLRHTKYDQVRSPYRVIIYCKLFLHRVYNYRVQARRVINRTRWNRNDRKVHDKRGHILFWLQVWFIFLYAPHDWLYYRSWKGNRWKDMKENIAVCFGGDFLTSHSFRRLLNSIVILYAFSNTISKQDFRKKWKKTLFFFVTLWHLQH